MTLCIMTLCKMTLCIITLHIMKLHIITLSIITHFTLFTLMFLRFLPKPPNLKLKAWPNSFLFNSPWLEPSKLLMARVIMTFEDLFEV
jgi:hypothetical protein